MSARHLVVTVTIALSIGALSTSPRAGASTTTALGSIVGLDRYSTAAQAATAAFTVATTVVITSGTTFPDALSASYLAGAVGGPILLTDPATLSPPAAAAITALRARTATIVGGPFAVSIPVEQQLTAMGLTVTRVSGATRYDTSAAVALSQSASHVGTVGGMPTAILASGATFPDALAAGPLAFARALPVILTDSATLSAPAAAALRTLGVTHVLIAGGVASVSSAVEAALDASGITTTRLAGADRFDTAARIAAYAVNDLGFSFTRPALADGTEFPDALAAGPFAGKSLSPILLTHLVPAATAASLAANAPVISGLVGFGRAAADVPASALAAGATLAVNGTVTAQGTSLCGFPSSFAFTGQIASAVSAAPGHLSATLTTDTGTSTVDIDLTMPGGGMTTAYTDLGATFRAAGAFVSAGGTVTLEGLASVTMGSCTAPYTLQAAVG